jgi:hypothetical protein
VSFLLPGSKKKSRFCYSVAKNGSVTKEKKEDELAGQTTGDSPETSPESP